MVIHNTGIASHGKNLDSISTVNKLIKPSSIYPCRLSSRQICLTSRKLVRKTSRAGWQTNFDCNTITPKGYKVAANFPRVNRFVFASDCRI